MSTVGNEFGSVEGRGLAKEIRPWAGVTLPFLYTPDREPVGELSGGVFLYPSALLSSFLFSFLFVFREFGFPRSGFFFRSV